MAVRSRTFTPEKFWDYVSQGFAFAIVAPLILMGVIFMAPFALVGWLARKIWTE